MKKTYTKKQIREAISYWEGQLAEAAKYPMWWTRLQDARNKMLQAVEMMEQAWLEDGHNPRFGELHKKMRGLFDEVQDVYDECRPRAGC